jgi:hypothetical protein
MIIINWKLERYAHNQLFCKKEGFILQNNYIMLSIGFIFHRKISKKNKKMESRCILKKIEYIMIVFMIV